MKKFQALFAIALCGLIGGIAANANAQGLQAGFATVVLVKGMVSYSLGDDPWHPLVAGKILPVVAIIRTGENGVTDLVLGKDIQLPKNVQHIASGPGHPTTVQGAKVAGLSSFTPAQEQNVIHLTPETTLAIDKLTVIDTGADTVVIQNLICKRAKFLPA